jgi:hypothetical protein
MYESIVASLLASPEPAIRWKVRTGVLGEPAGAVREEVRGSALVRRLLSGGGIDTYVKWQGPHWVLAALADLGYPPGDEALHPLRDRVLATWLDASRPPPLLRGRHRAHASQQGNALWFLLALGLDDGRCADLAELLLRWQWPDGGWNCDRDPGAHTSSFHETLLPMRGLWAYGETAAARRAAEVFLVRRLVYRVRTGELIRPEFAKLHYPLYWHYDVLAGLKGMAELGLAGDPRCADALDLLESMRLADGWPATARYHRASAEVGTHHDWVDWGGTSVRRANPWVTADALAVLRAAGRLNGA